MDAETVFVIQERQAPLFRGRPDFTPSEFYGRKMNKIHAQEIGYFFDELTQRIVRVVASALLTLRDEQTGKPVLGLMMSEELFLRQQATFTNRDSVAKTPPIL